MADKKISELTALTAANVAGGDLVAIVDVSASETKKVSASDVAEYVSTTSAITNLVSAKANLAGPTFTGVPAAPTAAADTNTTQIATTAFVVGQAGSATPLMDNAASVGTSLKYARQDHAHPSDTTRAPLASPTFTGTPAAPTAAVSTSTTQVATTAFVMNAKEDDQFILASAIF